MEQHIADVKRKLIVVVAIGLVLCILLAAWFTNARYASMVEAIGEYEPSLFNTVLLGDLSYKDENGVIRLDGDGTGRLSSSIFVNSNMEFGAVGDGQADLTSSERRLRPGSMIAIPFTVTNGTTLPNTKDALENTLESNLAGTDIVYTLSLITTVNIPLEYDVYEYTTLTQLTYMKGKSQDDGYNYMNYIEETEELTSAAEDKNWGIKLDSQMSEVTEDPAVGYSRTYKISPFYTEENPAPDGDDKFYLQRDAEEKTIAAKRYMLVVYWPDLKEGDAAATELLRSTKYMKEIDILEIRLTVESFVTNSSVTTPSYTESGSPLLRISGLPVGPERYYQLPESGSVNQSNVRSRSTVSFSTLREQSSSGNSKTHYLDFSIVNKADTTYTYIPEEKVYRASSLTSLTDGRVAVAVPVKATMGTVNDYTKAENFSYEIEYGGKRYSGVITDQSITTEVWGENSDEETRDAEPYKNNTLSAYRIVVFEGLTLPELKDDAEQRLDMRLLVTSTDDGTTAINYDNKDNFKILIYQAEQIVEENP